ncbi:HAD family hydrolase [Streptomyces sp. NPDC002499]
MTDGQDALLSLLGPAKAVLFDFDGPICSLFGGLPRDPSGRPPTKSIADEIKTAARRQWELPLLTPEVEGCDDSHDLLQHLRAMYEGDPDGLSAVPLKAAEDIVAQAEARAVGTAVPAPYIVTLVRLLSDLDVSLAIVSNNAEAAVRAFLDRDDIGLGSEFGGSIFGRDPDDARLMKPDPHCVRRAISRFALDASDCLLVGDKLSDLEVAQRTGTRFLGYTKKKDRAAEMTDRGAKVVVASHQPVVTAAKKLRAARQG